MHWLKKVSSKLKNSLILLGIEEVALEVYPKFLPAIEMETLRESGQGQPIFEILLFDNKLIFILFRDL